MNAFRCLYCREWVIEDDMLDHLGEAHEIRKAEEWSPTTTAGPPTTTT
jgi:hypothetical protein